MKILLVSGARPNFMKIAPLYRAFEQRQEFQPVIIHTGQHFDVSMSATFFRQLDIPEPAYFLGINSGSHAVQTAGIMTAFEKVLLKERPEWVLVVGDVNSTLACSLVAAKEQIPVAHVEAGLRSFDRSMPEEINRIVTDSISDLYFVTEESAYANLLREGHSPGNIHFVGNLMIDTLAKHMRQASGQETLARFGLAPNEYVLATVHRPSNVDEAERLRNIIELLIEISHYRKVLFVLHPRTMKSLEMAHLMSTLRTQASVILSEPLGYFEFIQLMNHAFAVVTDSGGVQDETTWLGVPCLTLRTNTERPVTVETGTNTLCPGLETYEFMPVFGQLLTGQYKKGGRPPRWDGHAAERIADVFLGVPSPPVKA